MNIEVVYYYKKTSGGVLTKYIDQVTKKEIAENILRNVPECNKKYVRQQLHELDENFLDYCDYWNEKYYRNGFVDGSQLVMGCFDK